MVCLHTKRYERRALCFQYKIFVNPWIEPLRRFPWVCAFQTYVHRHKHARDGGLPILADGRSEEHTSELQSRLHLVCRLLLEKKKIHLTTPVRVPFSLDSLARHPGLRPRHCVTRCL